LQKRRLGTSDLFVSELGLGCMSLGLDSKKAENILHAAFELGINYFDTADLYDHGENEKIIGSTFKHNRDQVVIATKVGNRWSEQKDRWYWDPSKAYIKKEVKASLTRLNTDYIDLYQLHGGTIEDDIDETIQAFEELKAEGLIRYYGISSIRPNVIREYASKAHIVSVMTQYNILDRRPEEEILPHMQQHDISVVTRGSLAKGLLSNKMLEKASATTREKGYLDYSFSELSGTLTKLKVHFDRPMSEIALHFNLAQPAVASVIVGASSVEQLHENSRAVHSRRLTDDDIHFIRACTKENHFTEHR
jgi:aryl-alcohol dehydrogenase-like predicted oxidoreductase